MSEEQKEVIEEAVAEVRRVRNILELHELHLRNLGDCKVNPSDPCSIGTDDVADALSLARDNLDDGMEMLRAFDDTNVEEVK